MPTAPLAPHAAASTTPTAKAWWAAIRSTSVKKVQALLDAGMNPSQTDISVVHQRETALDKLVNTTLASRSSAATIIPLLIAAGADPFQKPQTNGTSPFELAMLTNGDAALARAMVSACAWTGKHRPHAGLAMSLAILHQPTLVRTLLERKISPNVNDGGHHTPLSWALPMGSLAVVTTLLDAGARLSDPAINMGVNVYLLAVDAKARNQETPAMFHERQAAVVDALNQRGWTMNDTARATIVGAAVKKRCPWSLIARLIELGADPLGRSPMKGLSALHLAVSTPGGYPYVAPLLDLGLDPQEPSHTGQTAIDRLRAYADKEPRALPMLAQLENHVLHQQMNTLALDARDGERPRRRL